MRYDRMLKQIQTAQDKFEAEMRHILSTAGKEDADVTTALLNGHPKRHRRGLHWTQTPAGRKRMAALAKGNHNRGIAAPRKVSPLLAFVVGVLRQHAPMTEQDLRAAMKTQGYTKMTVLGGLARYGYVRKTHAGYMLGKAAKAVTA